MKYIKMFIFVLLAAFVYSCKKDLGNYTYSPPSVPVITKFTDSTFNALVGDTLILKPAVTIADADPLKDLSYTWEIQVAEEARSVVITGYPLKMIYNLNPMLRTAKLTITDNRNGLKYYYPFKILGGTQFSTGQAVLSVQNGVTMLSFIKPDNKTVLSNLYFTLHGENLPSNPVQLYAKPLAYQPNTVEDYWVICQDLTKNSVVLNGSTMLRRRYFNDQFFSPPATIIPSYFEGALGVPTGVINDKLYISITSTAPYAPDFGKFSNPQSGDYTLAKYFTRTGAWFFGFDTKSKGFVSFDSGGNYMGSDYTVVGSAFDPKNIGMTDLVFMQAVPGISYAYFRDAAGAIYELSFTISMDNYSTRTITPAYKRVFKGASVVQADSKWQRSAVDVFYFTSNDKIYRYNPINEDLRTLDANFAGKKVTMLKLSVDGNTLTAGVDGSVITLDVSVGKNGVITQTINGIPGTPVDIVIRK